MKIAVVLMKYDYGIQKRGYSYEYINIFLPLIDTFGDDVVIHFDFYDEYLKFGKIYMNQKLKEFINSEKPDVSIFCLFEDEFDPAVLSELQNKTKTLVYFFDDPWRQDYAQKWIKSFNYFSTPDYFMFRKYKTNGFTNVFYTPFGFNKNIYKKNDSEKIYDVSFVGGYSPLRKWIFKELYKKGINVKVFGRGWDFENKWISYQEMVNVFNQSKINLNLSNSTYLDLNFVLWSLTSPKAIKNLILLKKNKEQVKGRHFEINACGGFQLSYFVLGLNLVYEIEKEIAVYEDIYAMPETINLYLKENELRENIAEAGYQRSLKDHTAQNYLHSLVNNLINNCL